MKNFSVRHLVASACAWLLLLAVPAPFSAAEDKTGPDGGDQLAAVDGVFLDVLDVNVVNVDVYVMDKKGNRITGLEKKDFELYQDGKPVSITNFFAIEGGDVKAGAPELPMIEDIAEPESLGDSTAVPEDQQLSVVVYIDNYNLHPFSRNRSFRFIRTFLRQQMRPGDRVMLVTYDRSLHERHPFTNDPELIASTLYELEELSAHRVHLDSDRRDLLQAIHDAENVYDVSGRVRTYAENLYSDLSFTIRALKDTVDQLAGLPGRKAVLYVSDGLAMRSAEDLFYLLDQRFSEQNMLMESFRYDLTREYQELTTHANSNRVTFYTLDAEGLRTYSYMDAQNQVAGGGAFIDQTHFHNLQAPLQMIAEETGGFAMINTNNFTKPLERMGADFDTYYSLGYSPASSGTGRYHRIEVKVRGRKDLRVRHREGFRNKPIETRMSDGTLAALYHGYSKNGLGVALEIGAQSARSDGFFDVPLVVKVPIKRLALLPGDEAKHSGRLRLYVAARDSEGGMSEVQDVPVPIDIPSSALASIGDEMYQYQITMMMKRGATRVAIGVHDEIGAETAFVSTGIQVGRR